MEEKSSIGWIVVAIVAIVAIVGLVLLFKGTLTGSSVSFVPLAVPTFSGCQPTSPTQGEFSCLCCSLIVGERMVSIQVQADEFGSCPYDGQTISDWYKPRTE